ncbi:MAG: hypothetical protein MI976_00395 [Pseudomonadales bacterium]|nr:hypothetical protein [Pseudomonadales bacterium]
MDMLSKNEFIKMIWGVSSHDRKMEKWNTAFVNNGGLVCSKEDREKARRIGMLFNDIFNKIQKGNGTRNLDVAEIIINNDMPTFLKGTEIEALIKKAQFLIDGLSNPRHT